MKSKIKKAKLILLFVAMLICGSTFAQGYVEQFVDLQFSNVHVKDQKLNFTIKMKRGADYGESGSFGPHGARIAVSNIFIDLVDKDGNPAILFNPHQGSTIALPEKNTVFNNLAWKVMSSSLADHRLGLTLTKGGYNNPPQDLTDEYMIVAQYSVPYASGNPVGAFIKITTQDKNVHYDYTRWGALLPASAGYFQDLPYNISKPAGYPIETGCPAEALWTGALDTDWHDTDNWVNPANGNPPGIPCATTNVYIPGSGYRGDVLGAVVPIHFPTLSMDANCNEITFFQGGQLGRVDLLTYNKARVQLNIAGSEQGAQYYNSASLDTDAYYKFAKAYSTNGLSAGAWHMLSMPIKGVVSGDLAYGGYPMTFMRKFNIQNITKANSGDDRDEEGGRFTEGDWSTSYTEKTELVNQGEGFAFYIYPQESTANFGYRYIATDEAVAINGSGFETRDFGLAKTNNIIEFPTYDNDDKLKSHRTQSYAGGQSTFYAINVYPGMMTVGALMKNDEIERRTRSNDDFKLIANGFQLDAETADNRTVMVGNPYASALDFREFYSYNGGTSGNRPRITNAYRIWNGTSFIDYNCATETATVGEAFTPYIAPMQAFFVTGNRNAPFTFDPEDMSTVSPKNTPRQLRSTANAEENIIRISASNQYATTSTVVGQLADAVVDYVEGEDVTKLFSPSVSHSYVPEVFTTTTDAILSMNYINNVSTNIAIGVRVPSSGSTTLTLTGMNNYNADKIELVDGETGQTIWNITGLSSYEHSFDNGEGDYQAGRFYLRIAQSTTGWSETSATPESINVYKEREAIRITSSPNNLIKQIRIYDMQGRMLYNNANVATDIYKVTEQFDKQQVVIVQVRTENNTESVKIKN